MMTELVDGEGFANDIYWSKLVEDLSQASGFQVVDFEVPIFGLRTHQLITNTTADEQGTTTCFVNGLRK